MSMWSKIKEKLSPSTERGGQIIGVAVGAATAPVTTSGGSSDIVDHVINCRDSLGEAGRLRAEAEARRVSEEYRNSHIDRNI